MQEIGREGRERSAFVRKMFLLRRVRAPRCSRVNRRSSIRLALAPARLDIVEAFGNEVFVYATVGP